MIKKLILGTANFDLNYGLKNRFKKLKKKEIKKIIYYSKKKNINYIDTAQSYKNTEKILGRENINQFKIITKFTSFDKSNVKKSVKEKYLTSINNLKTNTLHTVLFHNPQDLLKKKGAEIFNEIMLLKKKGCIKKIGVSVYTKKELREILKQYKIDVVQIPLNIFNQSFLTKNFILEMKKKNIEIHARSIFLQGLLLLKKKKIPKSFLRYSYIFEKWNTWLKKNKINNLNACLNFIDNQKNIKKFVVGVDSLKQLAEIVNFKKSKKIFNFTELNTKLTSVNNPAKW